MTVGVGLLAAALWGQAAAPPRLILVVSIDQMRADYLTRFAPLFQGGFKTLLDQGALFTNAHYRHANTETAPGHSVILSGRHPSSTGIVANLWWDPRLRKAVNAVDDPASEPVGGAGRRASPANFIGFMLGDKIRERWPESRVVGVAIKDRSAILTTGRRATAAYWFETGSGVFITSSYYTPKPPSWLVEFNRRRPADAYFASPWTRLLADAGVYQKYSSADDFPGEWDLKDTTFPHPHRGRPPEAAYYENLKRTPFCDDLVLQAALGALQAHDLGADAIPDLLTVSFSSGDTIGHTYGPFSQEAMDAYLRLDQTLAKLLRAVEARAGAGRVLVVLTSDHGVLPLPEWLQRQGVKTKRLPTSVLTQAVSAALRSRFPKAPNLVAFFDVPYFTFDLEAIQKHGLKRAEVEQVAARALLGTGAVAAVYTHADMEAPPRSSDPWIGFFRNSFFAARSPHLMVLQKENYYIDDYPGGTGHGTPYEYDRHVPIIWMESGVRPGRHAAAAGPEDIAPTLARRLGIDYPLEPDSRLLKEVLTAP